MGMAEREQHYMDSGVVPGEANFEQGTDLPLVTANIDNINFDEDKQSPQFAAVTEWLGAIAGLGDSATSQDREIAKYLSTQRDYALDMVETNEMTPAEADAYMAIVLEQADSPAETDRTSKASQKVAETALSSIA